MWRNSVGRLRAKRLLSQYKYYDLMVSTPTHPGEMSKKEKPKEKEKVKEPIDISKLSQEEKIKLVFGGRIKGEDRLPTSRTMRDESQIIAGVRVSAKPIEPDNCCMSGCINCVWEIYNQDVREWNEERTEAAKRLTIAGGRWPENFYAPVSLLKRDNLPLSIVRLDPNAGLETPPSKKQLDELVHDESWGLVPVGIQVFTDIEKKIKARHQRLMKSQTANA